VVVELGVGEVGHGILVSVRGMFLT
jgi:hypothetical protein